MGRNSELRDTWVLLLSALAGAIAAFFLHFFFIERLIIPDPCYYHSNKPGFPFLFDLFYSLSASDGYHPAPTLFSYIFTLAVGAASGLFIAHKRS